MSAMLKTGGEAKAMRTMKWPEEFNMKVDMTKVNFAVMKKWVSDEVFRILQLDDDVTTGYVLEELNKKSPDIKNLQYLISGLLNPHAPSFCLELWRLLLSAQKDPNGIPRQLIEAKKLKLIEDRVEEDKQRAAQEQQRRNERERDRELAQIRERERRDRGGRGRGGRYYDHRPPRDSRSPPRRRNGDDFYRAPARTADSYVPGGGRGRRDRNSSPRRGPSPFDRSRSRSPRRESSRHASPAGHRTGNATRHDTYRRRSPAARRRSSPSQSDDERYPPPSSRRRHWSPSRARSPPRGHGRSYGRRPEPRSRSRSPPPRRPGSSRKAPGDLMSSADRAKNSHRLERPGSSGIDSSLAVSPSSRPHSSSAESAHNTPRVAPQTDEAAKGNHSP